jgi:hypothetical protein
MTWKALAKRTNSLPEGWSTTDEIALDLDCEISEIPKILAAAIRDGLVERQNFPCWTPGSRQLLYQTGYRQRTGTKPPPAKPPPPRLPTNSPPPSTASSPATPTSPCTA